MEPRHAAGRTIMAAARCDPESIEETRRRVHGLVRDDGIGGLIIFGGDRESVGQLIADARAAAGRPLLTASDLERGLGRQVGGGAVFPSPMAIAATGDPGLAFEAGRLTAAEARSVGIDLILAPVADLADRADNPIVGNRSFGDDPKAVRSFVESFVRGCRAGGAGSTVKHFPGHGGTGVDSHIELPVVDAPAERLRSRELEPFRGALSVGVDAVMTAHVAYPALDPAGGPAGFSTAIVDGLLRRDLGFDGLVLTDALIMGGAEGGTAAAARRAVAAGSDVLLMPEDAGAAVEAVVRAAADDPDIAARVERSAARVEALSRRVQAIEPPRVAGAGELAARIAAGAVTSVGWPGDPTAVARAEGVVVVLAGEARRVPERSRLVDIVGESCAVRATHRLTEDGGSVERAAADAAGAGWTVVVLYDEPAAWRGSSLPGARVLGAVRAVLDAAASATLVLCAPPFALSTLDARPPTVCAWDTAPASEAAAARVLLGAEARGVAPVTLPGGGA